MNQETFVSYEISELLPFQLDAFKTEVVDAQIRLLSWFRFLLNDLKTLAQSKYDDAVEVVREVSSNLDQPNLTDELVQKLADTCGVSKEAILNSIDASLLENTKNFLKDYFENLQKELNRAELADAFTGILDALETEDLNKYFENLEKLSLLQTEIDAESKSN